MSGLVLKVAPGERFLVNGALLENGDKPARIRISDTDARVLRCRHAIKPEDVNTPVKQIYFAIQLLITGDLEANRVLPSVQTECSKLADVFEAFDPDMIPLLRSMVRRGNYYSALVHLRSVIALETAILSRRDASVSADQVAAA
jgi:flagellar protein FlbT